jgi:hypothetical protein
VANKEATKLRIGSNTKEGGNIFLTTVLVLTQTNKSFLLFQYFGTTL